MAKRVIVLERREGSPIVYGVLFWLTVPVARQSFFARPGAKSAWPGASQAENDAIAAGQILELTDQAEQQPSATEGDVAVDLQARWEAKQAALDASTQFYRYGTYWDDVAGWTLAGA